MRVTITYDEVKSKATARGPCPICGKTNTRSTTCTETINPFNRNADGEPKTPAEVRASVDAKARAWKPPPERFTCVKHLLEGT